MSEGEHQPTPEYRPKNLSEKTWKYLKDRRDEISKNIRLSRYSAIGTRSAGVVALDSITTGNWPLAVAAGLTFAGMSLYSVYKGERANQGVDNLILQKVQDNKE